MALHDVLATHTSEVMARWKADVHGTLAPESMPPIELVDHLPEFLEQIIVALRDGSRVSAELDAERMTMPGGHGTQRLRLGFSLDSVVREYGAMRDAIVATARATGLEISFHELQIVFDCSIAGIARAVSEYSQQRDAEMARHANEHFSFIAHELRNPLSSAIAALELLQLRGEVPTTGRPIQALARGLDRTRELIEQTLTTARVSSGIELDRQPTLLSALIADVEIDSISEAESKGIELVVQVEHDREVQVDRRLVRSAIGNLLRNAVKYSHPSSTIALRCSIANDRAQIEIEDGCGGLEPGKVEAAFAPFVRIDKVQSGFGLGLAIAKQAVDAHGGSIRVQNLPGKGCIFVLELPVEPPPTAPSTT